MEERDQRLAAGGCQRGALPIAARARCKTRAMKRYPFLDARRRHLVLGAGADRSRRGVQEKSRNEEVRRGGQRGYHEQSIIPENARAALADTATTSSHRAHLDCRFACNKKPSHCHEFEWDYAAARHLRISAPLIARLTSQTALPHRATTRWSPWKAWKFRRFFVSFHFGRASIAARHISCSDPKRKRRALGLVPDTQVCVS
jgi:hypothetical protein